MFQAIKKAEKEVIELNKGQLDKGENYLGDEVGRYAESTQRYADSDNVDERKTFDTPYNFEWFGTFYRGFSLTVSGDEATLFSTGVGSGSKEQFLTTNNLFGLNDDNLKLIIQTKVIPFINKFARATLKI